MTLLTAAATAERVRSGRLTAVDATRQALARIGDDVVHGWRVLRPEQALAEATPDLENLRQAAEAAQQKADEADAAAAATARQAASLLLSYPDEDLLARAWRSVTGAAGPEPQSLVV